MLGFRVLCFYLLGFYFLLKASVLDTDNAESFEVRLAILQAVVSLIICFILMFKIA